LENGAPRPASPVMQQKFLFAAESRKRLKAGL
jgi:hypothetical protein